MNSRFDEANVYNKFPECLIVLDVSECPVQRPKDPQIQKLLWSGKKKMHTLKYECKLLYFNNKNK